MSAVTVPWLAVCTVLMVAGIAKLRRPEPTVGALRAAGIRASRAHVHVLAAGEVVLAVVAVATATPLAAVGIGILHLGFAAFVQRARRRGGMAQTCGCFGIPDVPATMVHVVTDLAAAAVAFVAAASARVGTVGDLVTGGLEGAVVLALAAVATFQLLVVLTVLPRASFAAVPERRPSW